MAVFTIEERARLRDTLVAAARGDPRISGAAITGSAALGEEDRWSDVDLAFGIADEARRPEALADWTELMYGEHRARHHVDVPSGRAIYRVFFLANTLQVDLAFFPAAEFGAARPSFRLLFGEAVERPHVPPPTAERLIGYGWLYALHARSSIERGRPWQAEYMLSAARDHVLALAALRHGLRADEARGTDRLPRAVTVPLEAALVRSLDADELRRAFGVTIHGLLSEIRHADARLAERLAGPLGELIAWDPPA